MKQKIHNNNFIRFIANQIAIVTILTMANSVFAQSVGLPGYIYLHKNATDENSSPNFSFNVTGSGFNQSYALNDQHPRITVQDVGGTGNGGLYAVAGAVSGSGGYGVYLRAANATTWTQISGMQATRIDGGIGSANIHMNSNGEVYYYSGSGAGTSNLGSVNAVDVAFDKSGTNRVFYVNSAGQGYYRFATSGTWTQVSGLTADRIDVAPNGFLISNGNSGFNFVYKTDFNGANSVNLGSPTGGRVQDVAVGDDGVIYAVVNQIVYRYSNGYAAGGTWEIEVSSRLSWNITGGNGGQIWSSAGGAHIWSRTSSGFWIDDEAVRAAGDNNNSVVIPVTPGTYSVVESATSGWSLGAIDIYDPSNNTTANVATGTTTVNVGEGEVVHLVYRNFLVQSFTVVNDCSGTAYFENFGAGTATTLGGPLTGQTSYHHISANGQFMNDGYYMVASRTGQAGAGGAAYGNFPDHTTGNGTGRMMIVNASYDKAEFFRRRFTGLLPGTQYSFSAWILNLNNATIKPNVRFEVNNPGDNVNLSNLNTGNITTTGVWTQYQLQFTATQSSVDLVLRNNNIGGEGNDLALDDIRFGLATPNQPIAQSTDADCTSGTGTITVTAPLGSSVEYSIDGTNYQASPYFTAVPAGNYSITARYLNSVGCTSTAATVEIDLETAPVIGFISGTTDPCSNGTTGSVYTYTNSTPGGIWSVSPSNLATIDPTTGVLTTVSNASGTAVVTYSINTGVCVSTTTFKIDVSTSNCTPMPVTLLSFTARKRETNSTRLEWVTTEESNSDKFEVQHSTNGTNWNLLSIIAAKGDSKVLADYHYTHIAPVNGENLYRLRMVDLDGTFAYSRIVSQSFDSGLQILLYPNPAANLIKVKLNGITNWSEIHDVKIYDMNGNAVYTSQKLTSGEINVSQFGAGTYVISITNKKSQINSARFTIAK